MCYISGGSLRKIIQNKFNKSPKLVLREVRYEKIVFLIQKQGWDATSQFVAIETGIGVTSDSLYKFLSRYYNTTFTQLRQQILNEERRVKFVWLNGWTNLNER